MSYQPGFGRPCHAGGAAGPSSTNPHLTVLKWAVGLLIACVFCASAVCRADDTQGRLYNDIEEMGISGSALLAAEDEGPVVDQSELFLSGGECLPQVPLPAALWAGLAGGAGVFLKRGRRSKR